MKTLPFSIRLVATGLTTMSLLGLPAWAADTAGLTEQINDCAQLTSPSGRLECYDRLHESLQQVQVTAPALPEAVATAPPRAVAPAVSGEVVGTTVVQPPVEESAPATTAPRKATVFGDKKERPADKHLLLVKREKDSFGRWVFYFDNGQVWRQTEKDYISIPRTDTVPATISAGVLGSYNLSLGDNRKKTKIKRLK